MSGTTTGNWQQYSRWLYVVARSCKKNYPTNVARYPIIARGAHTFTIAGDHHLSFVNGSGFTVYGSTNNDALYHCNGDSVFGGVNTVITVHETVGAVADGNIYVGELAAVEQTIRFFLNTGVTPFTGTRPWLYSKFDNISAQPSTHKPGDPTVEPTWQDAKMLSVIARDVKGIPLTAAEQAVLDNLFIITGNRRYGSQGATI